MVVLKFDVLGWFWYFWFDCFDDSVFLGVRLDDWFGIRQHSVEAWHFGVISCLRRF